VQFLYQKNHLRRRFLLDSLILTYTPLILPRATRQTKTIKKGANRIDCARSSQWIQATYTDGDYSVVIILYHRTFSLANPSITPRISVYYAAVWRKPGRPYHTKCFSPSSYTIVLMSRDSIQYCTNYSLQLCRSIPSFLPSPH